MRMMAFALLVIANTTPVFAQTLGQGADAGPPLWRVLLVLLLCLGLAVAGAFALRWRLGGRAPAMSLLGQRRTALIERTRLSHQVDLCLVRCDEREFLITTSPQGGRFGPEVTNTGSANETGVGGDHVA